MLRVGQGRLHSKGGTAAISSRFQEVNQGWPLKPCSAFSIPHGLRSQMPSVLFPFFLYQLCRVSLYLQNESISIFGQDSPNSVGGILPFKNRTSVCKSVVAKLPMFLQSQENH